MIHFSSPLIEWAIATRDTALIVYLKFMRSAKHGISFLTYIANFSQPQSVKSHAFFKMQTISSLTSRLLSAFDYGTINFFSSQKTTFGTHTTEKVLKIWSGFLNKQKYSTAYWSNISQQ